MNSFDFHMAGVAVSSWLSGWFWAHYHLGRKIRKLLNDGQADG